MSGLREVAERAGVSVATAWRVASGSEAVRPETRSRVERAMRELLYVPPSRQSETGVIGLLVPDLENPIFPALAQAIETRATAAGLAAILCNTACSPLREGDYVHMLVERRVDGMIFISCEMTDLRGDHGHYARLLDEGARMVFVNGAINTLPVPSVSVDERAAGQLATMHLLELGHTQIGYVAGLRHYMPTEEKEAGRIAALEAAGLPLAAPIAYDDFTAAGGARAIGRLLDGDGDGDQRRPTGVICSNDLMAMGVLHEARSRGLRVPEDLSVVGFDGIDLAAWTTPALTTVAQPIGDIATTALEALRMLIDQPGRAVPRSVFIPRLTVRGSTGPPPAT